MYEPTEEERKQEHKRRVEAKMKSLMEERAGEELMKEQLSLLLNMDSQM